MNTNRHINLLRAHRKRTALSQGEIAFLMGAQSASKISRYEKMVREPELKTVLAFEAIFNCPAATLFPGFFQQIEKAVRRRAKQLAKSALKAASRSLRARKSQALSSIINNKPKKSGEKQKGK